jgi:hypothetical protein
MVGSRQPPTRAAGLHATDGTAHGAATADRAGRIHADVFTATNGGSTPGIVAAIAVCGQHAADVGLDTERRWFAAA